MQIYGIQNGSSLKGNSINSTTPICNQQLGNKTKLSQAETTLVKPSYAHYASLVNFNGIYDPSNLKMKEISLGLKGFFFKDGRPVVGPDYTANDFITKELTELLTNGKLLGEAGKAELTEMKTYASNYQAFITSKETKPMSEYGKETEQFLETLQTQIPMLNKTLKDVGLSTEETDFLHNFIAQTAPTLYAMGFKDAIPHSTQVARKCMVETYKKGGTSTDILQSGLVGWIHDPKFPGANSWENLATHPIIAESLAYDTLNRHQNKVFLSRLLGGGVAKVNKFIDGVAEALPINNDSKWVTDNVILPKFASINGVKELAQKRFEAPQKNELPPQFPSEIREKMQKVTFETGIKGIIISRFKSALKELSAEYSESPGTFWQATMLGKVKDKALLSDLKNMLEKNGGIVDIKVNGDNLFCHHQEVMNAPHAAKSLIIADPMLLSPHKIIMEGSKEENTVLKRIQSFCKSFNNNIGNIPKESIGSSKQWQKEVYTSMIKSADDLTGSHYLQKFEENNASNIDEQIDTLSKILKDESTWGIYSNMEPTDITKSIDIKKVADTIKQNYEITAENSKEMFSIN